MYLQVGFRKGRGSRDQIANIHWIIENAKEFPKNIYFCLIYAKVFDCVDHSELWKFFWEMGVPDYLTCPWTCMQIKKQQLELDMEQWTDLKLGKEYVKAIYCHSAYLIICWVDHAKCQAGWSTSWNQDCQERYQNLIYADDTTLRAESEEELKSLLLRVKEES